jgi:hypothetical protein
MLQLGFEVVFMCWRCLRQYTHLTAWSVTNSCKAEDLTDWWEDVRLVSGFRPRPAGFEPGSDHMGLWWTKWYWGRFSPRTSALPWQTYPRLSHNNHLALSEVGTTDQIAYQMNPVWSQKQKNKVHDLRPRANYTDRATAACRRSDCQLCG